MKNKLSSLALMCLYFVSSAYSSEIGSCDKVDCPNGFTCQLDNNIAKCVFAGGTSSSIGSTVTSGGSWSSTTGSWSSTSGGGSSTTGSWSSTTGWPSTTGNGNACNNVECPRGYECRVENGKASCEKKRESCDNKQCDRGYHCEIQNDCAVCVRDKHEKEPCDPCDDIVCPSHHHCLARPEGGWSIAHKKKHWQLHPQHCGGRPNNIKAICIPSPKGTCKTVDCPRGYKCKLFEDGPHCVKVEKPRCLSCSDMHCESNGLVCVLIPQTKKDEDCCPIVPTCIQPTTIASSTVATSSSAATRHGTTIASVADINNNRFNYGGTGGIWDEDDF